MLKNIALNFLQFFRLHWLLCFIFCSAASFQTLNGFFKKKIVTFYGYHDVFLNMYHKMYFHERKIERLHLALIWWKIRRKSQYFKRKMSQVVCSEIHIFCFSNQIIPFYVAVQERVANRISVSSYKFEVTS